MKKKLLLLMALSGAVYASPSEDLEKYLSSAKTVQADFVQTIISGKTQRTAQGTMEISRPNKFRWNYTKDQQLIISDAKKIYIYDQPLQQVTVKALGTSIDKSPAALLAGANNIGKLYDVKKNNDTPDSSTEWFIITPKNAGDNNGFQTVQMGFNAAHQLSQMKFVDTFGNQTSLMFNNVKTGITLPASDFVFKVPAGVDVLEQ